MRERFFLEIIDMFKLKSVCGLNPSRAFIDANKDASNKLMFLLYSLFDLKPMSERRWFLQSTQLRSAA